ncbi:hypothetical protein DWZ56_10780 [Lachnotalea sp. AF33-28]|nr:hypothetical protein DWZ56_10780 [Lachnotalea sp. AF33-28]
MRRKLQECCELNVHRHRKEEKIMKKWKKYTAAGVAVLLAGTMAVGYISLAKQDAETAADGNNENRQEIMEALKEVENKSEQEITGDVYKDETVYVTMAPDGSVEKIIVSDWLKNAGKEAELKDVSELTGIQNVKGDETFEQNGTDLVWKTEGADIYYQGTSDQELPVSMNITYELDGRKISPSELSGKSGAFKMTVSYEAADLPFTMLTGVMLPSDRFSDITVENGRLISDGKTDIVVGIGLPGLGESLGIDEEDLDFPDSFTITANVTDFEMGPTMTVASCGLLNDMNLDEFEGMDELTDALDELSDASAKLVDGSEELKDGINTLQSKTGEFTSGIDTLNDGLNQLQNGAGTLKDGVNAYTDGANTLADGVNRYVDGANTLAGGVNQYVDGTQKLAGGVKDYVAGVSKVAGGIGELKDKTSALTMSQEQLDAINSLAALTEGIDPVQLTALVNGAKDLDAGLKAYNQGLAAGLTQLTGGLESGLEAGIKSGVETGIASAVPGAVQSTVSQVLQTLVTSGTLSAEQAAAVAAGLNDALNSSVPALAEGIAAQVAPAVKDGVVNSEAYVQGVNGLMNAIQGESGAGRQLEAGAADLNAGIGSLGTALTTLQTALPVVKPLMNMLPGLSKLPAAITQLQSGVNELMSYNSDLLSGADQLLQNSGALKDGAGALTSNSAALKDGANELSGQSSKLKDGAGSLAAASGQLKDGGSRLREGTGALRDGVLALADGADTLASGMKEFDETGIQKLKSTFDGDIQDLLDKVDSLTEDTGKYKSFSGIREDMEGSVKFIFETAEIR